MKTGFYLQKDFLKNSFSFKSIIGKENFQKYTWFIFYPKEEHFCFCNHNKPFLADALMSS